MHDRTWILCVTAGDVSEAEGKNPIGQTPLELASDLQFTDEQPVIGGRWEKVWGGLLKPRYRKEQQ